MKYAIRKFKKNSLENITDVATLTRNVQQELSLCDPVRERFSTATNVFYIQRK
jgi:hypothetical protein